MRTNIFSIHPDWRNEEQSSGGKLELSDMQVLKDKVPEIRHLFIVCYSVVDVRGSKDKKIPRS
jgi:hypothetical protein